MFGEDSGMQTSFESRFFERMCLDLHLTDQEKQLLNGVEGEAKQAAMDLMVKYGEALNADRLLDVNNIMFAVYSPYPAKRVNFMDPNDYDAIYAFRNLGVMDKKMTIPRMATNCGTLASNAPNDYLDYVKAPKEAYDALKSVDDFKKRVGISTCNTCVAYLTSQLPAFGEHLVWGESSAVVFANSVLGARTNCEGKEAGGAAALIGKIPNAGLHLSENRHATHVVYIESMPQTSEEWDLMGYSIGSQVVSGIPLLVGDFGVIMTDEHKSLGCAMSTAGSVDLYHVLGHTPEAYDMGKCLGGNRPITLKYGEAEKKKTKEKLDFSDQDKLDIVIMGCPHYSIAQMKKIAYLLEGKKCAVPTIIMTSRQIKVMADWDGLTEIMEAAGVFVLMDTCLPNCGVYPPSEFKSMATDSGKQAHYMPSYRPDAKIHLGSIEQCLEGAVTGIWKEKKG